MTIKVGTSGFGCIGRNSTRVALAQGADIETVAVNDLIDNKALIHLLKYGSILGKLDEDVTYAEDSITMGDKTIKALGERGPAKFPWSKLGMDIVAESTSRFTDATAAKAHFDAGAKEVIISALAKDEDAISVVGINEQDHDPRNHDITSDASCITNYLASLAKVLDDEFGIIRGLMITIHAYTADQNPQDGPHKGLRYACAAAPSIVPTRTDAAQAVTLALSESKDKFDSYVLRISTPTGSVTDLTLEAEKPVIVESINAAVKTAAEGPFKSILAYTEDPITSKDIETDPHSSISDSGLIKVIGNQVKVIFWYDNEWSYSNRLVDLAKLMGSRLWCQ